MPIGMINLLSVNNEILCSSSIGYLSKRIRSNLHRSQCGDFNNGDGGNPLSAKHVYPVRIGALGRFVERERLVDSLIVINSMLQLVCQHRSLMGLRAADARDHVVY